jgi:hypothetical protein
MFRITQDPSSGSIDPRLIKTTCNGSNSACFVRCRCFAAYSGPVVCVRAATHTTSIVEQLRVVLIKYESILPDDGSCVIRNMLE